MTLSLFLMRVLLAATLLAVAVSQQDHYSVLGVPRTASDDDIKKAFKKLARKLHPDAQRDLDPNQREAARKRFMAISDAYEVLGDKKKRDAFDNYGGRQGSGDDRMFLRNNLFAHDFDGDQINSDEVERALQGKSDQSVLLFLWSSNVPDCIDPGLDYKRVAQRLVGSSVRVAAMRCDDMNYQACRFALQVPNLPSLVMIPSRSVQRVEHYNGKFEFQAMTEFGSKFLKEHTKRVIGADLTTVMERCPNPAANKELQGPNWIAPYFAETSKRSFGGTWTVDFVALEFSPCFDCNTELNIAVESLAPVMPSLVVRKVRCDYSKNRKLCNSIAGKQLDRAWTIARISQRCFYATKKPFVFSDEYCDAPQVDVFEGKYNSGEMVQFIMGNHATHIITLRSLRKVKASNESYAVLFVDNDAFSSQQEFLSASPAHRHWEILARQVNTYKPLFGAKKFRLKIAIVYCGSKHNFDSPCGDVQGQRKPVVGLYPFGLNAKKLPPITYDRINGAGILAAIEKDMEPLHLHVINHLTWKSKVMETLNKGKNWLVLFNAGQWCPPCTHIRSHFKAAARIVQNSNVQSKLSVAVIECDEHRNLCDQQNINNYPTVFFYAKGRDRMTFNGNREGNAMAEWAIDAIDSRLQRLDFREIQMNIQRGATMMINFNAGQWCPPCMQIIPVYKQVANKLSQIIVTELNCDTEQWACQQFGVPGFPTVVLYHKGQRYQYEGNKQVDLLTQWALNIAK